MEWLKRAVYFVWGYALGFATLFVLIMIFGDYSEPVANVQPVAEAQPAQRVAQVAPANTPTPVGVTYEQICGVDENNMTDPQLSAHAARYAGQTFNGWQGWVYDVTSNSDGSYDLQIAMSERGLFWTRDIVVEHIPTDLAMRLNVEQPIMFDGRVQRVDYAFEVMCNPMTVDNFTLR